MRYPNTSERQCKICNKIKPHNKAARRKSKESGWMGYTCWSCFVYKQVSRVKMERAAKHNGKALQEIW